MSRRAALVPTTLVADHFGVDRRTVNSWIKRGKLRGRRSPGGRYFVPREVWRKLKGGE